MTLAFTKATKTQAKGRIAFVGGPGTGKTYSALAVAQGLAPNGRIALIDTEHGSASKYAGDPFTFDTLSLDTFDPRVGVQAIQAAEAAGYEVIVIDSLSHFWMGKDGALEQVDRRAAGNKFTAWREVTPMHTGLVEAILQSKAHVIATMRSKVEYVVEVNDKGKSVPRKVGLAPIQRDGVEFEFDVVGDIDQDHNLRITKTRCRALTDQVIPKPGAELAATLRAWLSEGVAPAAPAPEAGKEAPASGSSTSDAAAAGKNKSAAIDAIPRPDLAPQEVRDRIKARVGHLNDAAKAILHDAGIKTVKDIDTRLTTEVATAVEAAYLAQIPA